MDFTIPKRYWDNIIMILASEGLYWIARWQQEIIDICLDEHRQYDLPFYINLFTDKPIWWWRDFWDGVHYVGRVLLVIALLSWERKRRKVEVV